MWKLLQYSNLLKSTLRYGSKSSFNQTHISKIRLEKPTIRWKSTCCQSKGEEKKLSVLAKVSLGLSTSVVIRLSWQRLALCERRNSHNRLKGYKQNAFDEDPKFDWKKFWSYLLPNIQLLIIAAIAALVAAIINIQIPQVIAEIVNIISEQSVKGSDEPFLQLIKSPAGKLVGLFLAQSLATFVYIYLLSNIGEDVAFRMKTDMFASILKQDISFFDQKRTGEIIHRLTTDVQEFKHSFKMCVSQGLKSVAQIIGSAVSLFFISAQMTGVTMIFVPTVITTGTLLGSLLRRLSSRAQEQAEKATAVADEAIGNIRTVRGFAMEDVEYQLYEQEAKLSQAYNEKLGFGIGLFQAGTNLFLNGMVLLTISMGGYLHSNHQISPGHLMAYLMVTQTIQKSLSQLSLLFGSMLRGMAAGARVFQYINLEANIPLVGGAHILPEDLKGNVEFKNVSFAYPTRSQHTVLNNFNMTVPSGKTVAIVGSSGHGKSTIVALLQRLYEIDEGSITLDGVDLRHLDPTWLRRKALSIISQEPVLFGTTIMENIRYGKPTASNRDVQQVAKLANAHEFIQAFPNGYDTIVGERGVTLSGGQKQRIAIARALLKDPCVLILDEATSALDTESEKTIQMALDKASAGRTVIIIAHRLSTIRNADMIIVVNKGQVMETGNHDELLKNRGHYWSLIHYQRDIDELN